jgi:hypothetical protein
MCHDHNVQHFEKLSPLARIAAHLAPNQIMTWFGPGTFNDGGRRDTSTRSRQKRFGANAMSIEYKDESGKRKCNTLRTDFCVVGGGMAGVCAALAAARNGAKTVLLQDRPVLGGNASSEVRMWICGAHGADNKEGGILEEILLDNYYYNPELKFTIWDDVLYGACANEPNLTLLLNCTVRDLTMDGEHIASVNAWHLTQQCDYRITASHFADCSGDSILRSSGARYRWGREGRDEFDESHAPAQEDAKTMGNSILLQLRETEQHIPFRAPSWAHQYTDETCPNRPLTPVGASNFWWLEIGGTQNTISDSDRIRDELLKIGYGVWDYIKNHPDGRGHGWELDWIGSLPGKRENVRYVGDHLLTQTDVEKGGRFEDVVAHGGWSMDDHHPEAIEYPGAPTIFHPAPSPYGIPYRSLYSANIENLFFAGRNISATHMAMSSTRVMATTAVMGQAVGTAAAIAVRENISPRGVYQKYLQELQTTLMEQDQFLPGVTRQIPELSLKASISHEALRNGVERTLGETDNGIWLKPGESCEYRFGTTQKVLGARLVFDSDFSDSKRMRCRYPKELDLSAMPGSLGKAFRLETLQNGNWHPVHTEAENRHRLVAIEFAPLEAEAIRLVLDSSWDGAQAHLFAFEVR